jgi:hypothetical protein
MACWIGFAIGLLTFVGAHAIEVAMWNPWFGGAHNPWFLNSGRAIVFTMSCLFGVSLIAGGFRVSGLMIAAGAATAMTAVLFLSESGPGTIFPIVLAGGGLFILLSSMMGAWMGTEIGRVVRARR